MEQNHSEVEGIDSVPAIDKVSTGNNLSPLHTIKEIDYPMILVETDTFVMGNKNGTRPDKIEHKVLLDPYYIGKFELTQYQWEKIMDNNPSKNQGCPDCPVERITWYEIQEFIKKLNDITNSNYSLPTEAQWEYAARGGKLSKGYKYAGINIDSLDQFAWYEGNPGSSFSKTKITGQLNPNEIGIYDMTRNVHEFCKDWFKIDYSPEFEFNPQGPDSTGEKVYRGGAYDRPSKEVTERERATNQLRNVGILDFV